MMRTVTIVWIKGEHDEKKTKNPADLHRRDDCLEEENKRSGTGDGWG